MARVELIECRKYVSINPSQPGGRWPSTRSPLMTGRSEQCPNDPNATGKITHWPYPFLIHQMRKNYNSQHVVSSAHQVLLVSGGNWFWQLEVCRTHHCFVDREMWKEMIVLHYVTGQLAETVQLALISIDQYCPSNRPRPNSHCTIEQMPTLTKPVKIYFNRLRTVAHMHQQATSVPCICKVSKLPPHHLWIWGAL